MAKTPEEIDSAISMNNARIDKMLEDMKNSEARRQAEAQKIALLAQKQDEGTYHEGGLTGFANSGQSMGGGFRSGYYTGDNMPLAPKDFERPNPFAQQIDRLGRAETIGDLQLSFQYMTPQMQERQKELYDQYNSLKAMIKNTGITSGMPSYREAMGKLEAIKNEFTYNKTIGEQNYEIQRKSQDKNQVHGAFDQSGRVMQGAYVDLGTLQDEVASLNQLMTSKADYGVDQAAINKQRNLLYNKLISIANRPDLNEQARGQVLAMAESLGKQGLSTNLGELKVKQDEAALNRQKYGDERAELKAGATIYDAFLRGDGGAIADANKIIAEKNQRWVLEGDYMVLYQYRNEYNPDGTQVTRKEELSRFRTKDKTQMPTAIYALNSDPKRAASVTHLWETGQLNAPIANQATRRQVNMSDSFKQAMFSTDAKVYNSYIFALNNDAKEGKLMYNGKPVNAVGKRKNGDVIIYFRGKEIAGTAEDKKSAYVKSVSRYENGDYAVISKGSQDDLEGLSIGTWKDDLMSGRVRGANGKVVDRKGYTLKINGKGTGEYLPIYEVVERKGVLGQSNEAFVDENDDLMAN